MQTIYASPATDHGVPTALRDLLAELRDLPGWPSVSLDAAALVADVLEALGYDDRVIRDLLGAVPADRLACA